MANGTTFTKSASPTQRDSSTSRFTDVINKHSMGLPVSFWRLDSPLLHHPLDASKTSHNTLNTVGPHGTSVGWELFWEGNRHLRYTQPFWTPFEDTCESPGTDSRQLRKCLGKQLLESGCGQTEVDSGRYSWVGHSREVRDVSVPFKCSSQGRQQTLTCFPNFLNSCHQIGSVRPQVKDLWLSYLETKFLHSRDLQLRRDTVTLQSSNPLGRENWATGVVIWEESSSFNNSRLRNHQRRGVIDRQGEQGTQGPLWLTSQWVQCQRLSIITHSLALVLVGCEVVSVRLTKISTTSIFRCTNTH